jgi:hypothetical protein
MGDAYQNKVNNSLYFLIRHAPRPIIHKARFASVDGSITSVTFSRVNTFRIGLSSGRLVSRPPKAMFNVKSCAVKLYLKDAPLRRLQTLP